MLQKLSSRLGVSKKTVVFIYKGTVLISAGSMFFLLYQMILTGIFGYLPKDTFVTVLSYHQAVTCLGWATLAHVILIKIGVYIKGGAKHDVVFFIHLFFAILFSVSVMVLVFSYTQTSSYHDILTYIASISYTVVAFIGIPMLFKRF